MAAEKGRKDGGLTGEVGFYGRTDCRPWGIFWRVVELLERGAKDVS
jgi:hypothetical protein